MDMVGWYIDQRTKFSQDLVNHLEDTNVSSPETSSHRQATLDSHIRARIAAELERLQAEEQNVRQQIETALERENLDRETALATSDSDSESDSQVESDPNSNSGSGSESDDAVTVVEKTTTTTTKKNLASSVALQAELEQVQQKVERFQKRRQLDEYPGVRDARDAVLQCYQSVF
jgi:altered-inheritance-of-mitochondria protein 13